VPTLHEVQNAMRKTLVDRDDGDASAMLAEHVPADRLDIYRNTFVMGATNALRLSYPAVHRLVGEDFFGGAAAIFIAGNPPRAANLDHYGAELPAFLEHFPPAAGLAYLPDVARLEWAVSRAVHAADGAPLALSELAALAPGDYGNVRFVPHPSIALLRVSYPVDLIWRAVLDRDAAALATLDLQSAPMQLLVQRLPGGVEVMRLDQAEWQFAAALCAGQPLQAALDAVPGLDATAQIARHLAAGRFVGFSADAPNTVRTDAA
jgi:hypothetical protein